MSEEEKKCIKNDAEGMVEVFSGLSDVFVKKIMHDPTHLWNAKKICEDAKRIGYSNSSILMLKVCVFECLMGPLRDFEAAKPFIEEIEKDLQTGVNLAPYYRALFTINKGFFEAAYNLNTEEAIRFMNEGLSILTGLNGYKKEQLRAISNLSQYYSLRGQSDIAERYIEQGKNLCEEPLSGVHCFFLFVWALLLID